MNLTYKRVQFISDYFSSSQKSFYNLNKIYVSFSKHPKPADQLHIPPTGSNDRPLGQMYSQPIRPPLSSRAHDMNFLHDVGCGKLPISRHSILPVEKYRFIRRNRSVSSVISVISATLGSVELTTRMQNKSALMIMIPDYMRIKNILSLSWSLHYIVIT